MENHLLMQPNYRLPVGFRFIPTDQELIIHYLYNKVHGIPVFPFLDPLIDFDVYGDCPGLFRLFEERGEETLYFFTRLRLKSENGSRVDRETQLGTWKSQEDSKINLIEGIAESDHIGSKRSFTFKPKEGLEGIGRWVMYEYRLDGITSCQGFIGYSVICKIIKKNI